MKPILIFSAIIFCVLFNTNASAQQISYPIFIDNYLITSDCVPYDSVKSAGTIFIRANDGSNTNSINIKYGSLYMPGIPRSGQIGANGILDATSKSYLLQSKGKQVYIEFMYYDYSRRANCMYSFMFSVC